MTVFHVYSTGHTTGSPLPLLVGIAWMCVLAIFLVYKHSLIMLGSDVYQQTIDFLEFTASH